MTNKKDNKEAKPTPNDSVLDRAEEFIGQSLGEKMPMDTLRKLQAEGFVVYKEIKAKTKQVQRQKDQVQWLINKKLNEVSK